jgi:MFS family permease
LLIVGGALLLLVPEFNLNSLQLGALATAVYAGSIIGAVISGWLSDAMGRRVILLADFFFFGICSIVAAAAQNVEHLIIARFLIGVGVGADVPPSYALIRDRTQEGARPVAWFASGVLGARRCRGWVGLDPALSMVRTACVAMDVSFGCDPRHCGPHLRQSIPETPRWLLEKGHAASAAQSVRQILGPAAGESSERVAEPATLPRTSVRGTDLLRAPFLGMLVVVGLMQFFNTNASALLLIWGPLFVHDLGLLTKLGSVFFSLILSTAFALGAVFNTALVDRVGRRPLLLGAAGFQVVGFAILIITRGSGPRLILILFPMLSAANIVAAVSVYTWAPEFFPTGIRARTNGLLFASSRFGAVVIGFVIPVLVANNRTDAVMLVGMAVEAALLALGVFWRRAETKGRSLEEILTT